MKIDADRVRAIAGLAYLDLDESDCERFGADLTSILAYVDKLEELDTEDVEPTTHAALAKGTLRHDEVEQRLTIEQVLANAPDQADNQFRVPKVVAS